MVSGTYWLDLFSADTWREFLDAGAKVSGFRDSRWVTVQRIAAGDLLLCYMTGVSRFIAILEVTGQPYQDSSPIWKTNVFTSRLPVKVLHKLTPETAIPVHHLARSLSFSADFESSYAWTGHFRGSPTRWKAEDGNVVFQEVRQAEHNPISRPVDLRKMRRQPPIFHAKLGPVTVPEDDDAGEEPTRAEATAHTEVQWLLLKLGADFGFDVWVARNDRSRQYDKGKLASLPRVRDSLPLSFDPLTMKTIELIDVLWLRSNSIVSAFEIESTTSIYSGLLRMSDLIAMQPNLKIPLYLVAPDDRRDKVFGEVNRPTFSRLSPPLWQVCRYISFDTLRKKLQEVSAFVKLLRPEFIADISESCEPDEAQL